MRESSGYADSDSLAQAQTYFLLSERWQDVDERLHESVTVAKDLVEQPVIILTSVQKTPGISVERLLSLLRLEDETAT